MCPRCIAEGNRRIVKNNDPEERAIQRQMPMRYCKPNTGIRFQYPDPHNPLRGLNLVEESLISPISVLVIIRTVEGMNMVGRMRYDGNCAQMVSVVS